MNPIILVKRLFRVVLMLVFRFEWWHTSPSDNKTYVDDVIKEFQRRDLCGSLLEIGCGLGDILGNISCREKHFYDLSPNVLRAAKFLQVLSSLHILLYIEFNYRTPSSLSVRMRW